MAATLPPLHSANPSFSRQSGKISAQNSRQSFLPKKLSATISAPKSANQRKTKFEKDFITKQEKLVKRLPKYDSFKISEYKSDDKKNVCTYLLRKGLHKSFKEIVSLIQIQDETRKKAGQDSFLWQEPLLVNQPEKLELLKLYLEESEKHLLAGNYEGAYASHKALAQNFTTSEDLWLKQHFFENCFQLSQHICDDDGRRVSEAHRNVGHALYLSGELVKALSHFEEAKEMRSRMSKSADQIDLLRESCKDLAFINADLAALAHSDERSQEAFDLYSRALEAALQSEDEKLIADCNYNLGHIHSFHGDAQLSIQYLRHYYEYCLTADDSTGIAKCCQDFSKAYERLGDLKENMKYLDKYMLMAERTGNEQTIIAANSTLGIRLNSLREYEKACLCLERALTMSRKNADADQKSVDSTRCFTGITAANQIMGRFIRRLTSFDSKQHRQELLDWKCERSELN